MSGSDHRDTDARELAQRRSGADELLLLWHPDSDRVELVLRNTEIGVEFFLDVEPGEAIDAFHHPYAYLAWRAGREHLVPAQAFA